MSRRILSLTLVLVIVAVMVAACATPEPQTIIETVVVETEKEVVVTKEVEVEKEVVVTQEVEVEKEVVVEVTRVVVEEVEVPIETVVRGKGPDSVLDLILVQHALCAWDQFWCTVEAGIKQASEDMNVNVTVLGPDEFDLEKTAQLIDQAVAAQPDGIALTVTDADLFREPIERALAAGIPVVGYNAGRGPIDDDIAYLTYLGQDEYAGGYLGGLKLAAEGGTAGVCINQQVGHTGLDRRCAGFTDALAEKGIPAEVLATVDDPAESQTIISDYYTANPETDIFLSLGPNVANPFYAFMEEAGLGPGDITMGTFDNSPEIASKIIDGTTMFGIDQQPFLQGYGAVEMLVMANRYAILPALPVSATGPGFIDQSNVDFEVDADRPADFILVQHALCAWDAFWCVVEKGIEEAAKQMNVNVTVLGPDEFDLEKTAQLIDQAVAAQPDGIALTVTDPDLFREPIQSALDAGIPVVGYNAGAGPIEDGIDYMTYLGQDEYAGGYLGGLRLAAEGGTKGVCINQQVGHTGLDKRCAGFTDALAEMGIPAEVLATVDDPAESQTIISDYYTANPDTDIFMSLGPNVANPFYAFMEESGLGPGDITMGTFDLSPEIIAKIKDGTTMFGIDQQPFLQGYGAVLALMLKHRHGISPALPVTPTGPGFVDASTVEVVEMLAGEYR
ncbi:sugar ABC transporter substrate-binding protein [Chloroflexota bacterium]